MHAAETNMQFAICIEGEEDGDLEIWKVYRVLPDSKAENLGCLRVIDESGEDYLYPQSRFAFLELPEAARKSLLATVGD